MSADAADSRAHTSLTTMFLLVNVDDDDPELEHAAVNNVAHATKRNAATAAGRKNNRFVIMTPLGGG